MEGESSGKEATLSLSEFHQSNYGRVKNIIIVNYMVKTFLSMIKLCHVIQVAITSSSMTYLLRIIEFQKTSSSVINNTYDVAKKYRDFSRSASATSHKIILDRA
jgi:hypothetical protein